MLWGSLLSRRREGVPDRSREPAAPPVAATAHSRRPQTTRLAPGPIVLAHEPAFDLAGMEVRPTSLEVLLPGRRELLEPRVMQVLTALARCRGEVVARNDLIQACWDGRIVSDDAVNRCISRIRKLAKAAGGFEVQTIPRVGFRLSETGAQDSRKPVFARTWMFAAAGAALALLAAAGWYWRDAWPGAASAPMRVAVEPFTTIEGDAAARGLSAGLGDRLSGVLTKNVVGLSLVPAGKADLRLTGAVSREGGQWRVRAALQETREHVTLWTGEFQRPVAEEAVLREEVPVAAADVVDDAIAAMSQKGWRPDPRSVARYLIARSAFQNATPLNQGEPRRLLEEAVARSPEFVAARASLAMVLTTDRQPLGEEGRKLAERARREAETAIHRDPAAAGAAYDALYIMQRMKAPTAYATAEDVLIEGEVKAPSFAFLHMRRCRFLVGVGRPREALAYCQRALGLKPLAAPLGYNYASALYAAGQPELATRAIERALRDHPDHALTQQAGFEIAAFSGSPASAQAMLHDSKNGHCGCGLPMEREAVVALDAFLTARVTGAPADIDRALAAMTEAAKKRQIPTRYLIFAAAKLGRLDRAFAELEGLANRSRFGLTADPSPLLDGPAAPLQRDPRFWPLAERTGLVAYWRARKVWPDFCSDPTLPYDCREAARAGAS